jgi:hypothetical protein
MKTDRRIASRKEIEGIEINDLTSISSYSLIARKGRIINASRTGFLLEIDRKALVPGELRDNLSLESTLGQQVVLYLPQMNLDLDGTIMRTSHQGKGKFLVAIDFSYDVPDYWRECLVDLLPAPGEMETDTATD